MAERVTYLYQIVRIPEAKQRNFEKAVKRNGGEVLGKAREVSNPPNPMDEAIDELLRILPTKKTPDEVYMEFSKKKLEARQQQLTAMIAGEVENAYRAVHAYYKVERMAIIYGDLLSGVIKLPVSSASTAPNRPQH